MFQIPLFSFHAPALRVHTALGENANSSIRIPRRPSAAFFLSSSISSARTFPEGSNLRRPAMNPRLFISAVTKEFGCIRQQVALVARQLGYEPVTMDDWSLAEGELLAWLRKQISSCEGIIHIPGIAYGAEPEKHDPSSNGIPTEFTRYSYTQYEFLYAQSKGLRTWVIVPGAKCTRDSPSASLDYPTDPVVSKPAAYQEERRRLQEKWIAYLKGINHIRHQPEDDKELKLIVNTLRDHAEEMRGRFIAWQDCVSLSLSSLEGKLDSLQESLSSQMREISDAFSRIQQQTDSERAPISSWPKKRLEEALAAQMEISVDELSSLITAGRSSGDTLVQAQAFLGSGDTTAAEVKFDQVIAMDEMASNEAKKRLFEAYSGKAQIAYDRAEYETSLAFRKRAVALVDENSESLAWADAQSHVAFVYSALGQFVEAEPILWRILRINEKQRGKGHPLTAKALNNLAQLLVRQNRLGEAEIFLNRALEIFERFFGKNHRLVAGILSNLSHLLQSTSRLKEAEALLRRSLVILESERVGDQAWLAVGLNNLAHLLMERNQLAESEKLVRRALEIDQDLYGADHPVVARDMNNLAYILRESKRLPEAEPLLRRALSIKEDFLGANHPEVAVSLSNLAQLLVALRRHDEAEKMMRRVLEIVRASYGNDHPTFAINLNNLAECLRATGRIAEAEQPSRNHVEILLLFQAKTTHRHPLINQAIKNYFALAREMGLSDQEIRTRLEVVRENAGLAKDAFDELWAEVLRNGPMDGGISKP